MPYSNDSNYPDGSYNDPSAPWNQIDPEQYSYLVTVTFLIDAEDEEDASLLIQEHLTMTPEEIVAEPEPTPQKTVVL